MRLPASFFLLALTLTLPLSAQTRIQSTINTNWAFHKGDLKDFPTTKDASVKWEPVSIPHSWNTTDVTDDEKGYYRGISWYTKRLYIPASWQNKEVSLYFEGAAQVTEVYINGKKAGQHVGSYAFFNIPIKQYLNLAPDAINEVAIKLDNSHNESIPPLSADFTFFGGIYRDVYLVATDAVHFDVDNNGSSGVFITTPRVTEATADVNITGAFVNQTAKARKLDMITTIEDAEGKIIAQKKTSYKTAAGEKTSFTQQLAALRPELWSPEHPYLYSITTSLVDASTKQQLDEVTNPLGFRWFNFDAEKGFFLNGKPYKLMGASRHQDYKNKGNALPDAIHVSDVQLLKDMGANFLRVAHYPQDPEILQACDRLGILASVETPIVNQISETPEFAEHCKTMQVEMIRQNFNHPSVVIWAYMNEVLLRPRYTADSKERETYYQNIARLAQQLEDITRKEDPSRYTMIPNHGAFDLYNRVGLTKIPMLVGWNLYQGWYSGDLGGFAQFLDKHHEVLPDKPFLVTEYGADADPRVHSLEPVRFDKSNEYAVIYHKAYIKAIYDRPFVVGAMIWNLADFNSEERAESMPHINNKGITTIDRQPKDTYWLYKAKLSSSPFIAIGSKRWHLRSAIASSDNLQYTQPVEVYSNQPMVTLKLNGKDLATVNTAEGAAMFNVPFANGSNQLQALTTVDGKTYTDEALIDFRLIPQDLKSKTIPFTELNISLGDKRYIVDDEQQQVWIPEQPYKPGSWGYIGGNVYKMNNGRLPYGSDKNILGTDNDPMYETQRIGLEEFRLDAPDGTYEITLHFAELVFTKKSDDLAYNLTSPTTTTAQNKDQQSTRAFNVIINDVPVLENLSTTNYLQPDQAHSTKAIITIKNGKGISIKFNSITAETILNGLQVRKLY